MMRWNNSENYFETFIIRQKTNEHTTPHLSFSEPPKLNWYNGIIRQKMRRMLEGKPKGLCPNLSQRF